MLKSIASNTLAQLTAKFFGAGLTLITTYFIIRIAGLEVFGDLTKILALVAVGATAIDFGLNAEAVRGAKTEGAIKQKTSDVQNARLFLALVAIIVLNALVYFLPDGTASSADLPAQAGYSREVKSLFWLGSLAIIFQSVYASGNAYFQYNLKYWRSTLAVIGGAVTTTALTLYYLSSGSTLFHLVVATTLGYLVMAIVTKTLLPELPKRSLSHIIPTLRASSVLGMILVASVLLSKTDTIILGAFRSSSEVGQYGFAYRFFDVFLTLPVFVMNALYPLMLKGGTTLLPKTLKTLGVIGLLTAVVSYAAAPLILLIRPGLELSVTSLRLLSLSLPFFYLTAPLMWNLIVKRQDKLVLAIYVGAAIVATLVNLYFIPQYGAVAAAITTGVTELLIFIALLYYSSKL